MFIILKKNTFASKINIIILDFKIYFTFFNACHNFMINDFSVKHILFIMNKL